MDSSNWPTSASASARSRPGSTPNRFQKQNWAGSLWVAGIAQVANFSLGNYLRVQTKSLQPIYTLVCAMRGRYKRWVLLSALLTILLVVLVILSSRPPATHSAITATFLGYTNAPNAGGGDTRFALFSLSNQAPYTVRWYGDSVEVEGVPSYHTGPAMNPNLPGYTRASVLKAGRTLLMAVGEPYDLPETGRWRFAMSYSRYTWRAWWVDQAFRGKLPFRVGPVVLVDAQRVLNATNHVTVTTAWLTK